MPAARTRLFLAAVVLAILLYLGARRVGPVPALGGFLDPANGVWALARGAELPARSAARIPGLTAPVEVLYDDRGVPHVFAATEEDAWRAEGYVVARDRLFQLELQTRAAAGTLSELLGARLLPADRAPRALCLRRGADAHLTLPVVAPGRLLQHRGNSDRRQSPSQVVERSHDDLALGGLELRAGIEGLVAEQPHDVLHRHSLLGAAQHPAR